MTVCEHCGAEPSGALLGLPVIVHQADCVNCPKCPKGPTEIVFGKLTGGRRYQARDRITGMLIAADEPDGPWYSEETP